MNSPLRLPPGTKLLRCIGKLGLLASLVTLAPCADATVYTWMGTGTTTTPTNGNWSIPADWSGGLPASAATTELDFASSTTSYVSTNNIGTVPFELNILTNATGSGTGTDSVTGNSAAPGTQLEFVANGSSPVINQNGGGILSITAPLDLASGLTIQSTGVGQVALTGAITDTGSLTISRSNAGQTGVVLNNANNAYSGGTFVTAGSVIVDAPGSLGTGTLTLGGTVAPKLTFSTTGGTYNNNLAVTGTNATIEADVTTTITGTAASNIASGEILTL
jgi:autotransporter-associated beta strand protein